MKVTGKLLSLFLLTGLLLAVNAPAFGAAHLVIVNVNAPGVGFNDPTPATPVGGNPGTTRGQQALNVFQFAADVWGSILDSQVPIFIQASFQPLPCTPTSGTLGAAGTITIWSNFPGREYDNTWYHAALANKLAGADLFPGPNGSSADDIVAFFNSNLGTPGCLTATNWYYGLDDNHGNLIDLATVLLHEFGHGLGFATFVSKSTGANLAGLPDIFGTYTLDDTTGKHFPQMTNAERKTAITHTNHLVWDGLHVTQAAPSVLQHGSPLLTINTPASLGTMRIGPAVFGPPITSPGVTGNVVQALDPANPAGPTTFDACSPLTNAGAVAGNIALVDRGSCGFVVKVKNAQNAGAVGVIVADNAPGSPPAGLGGADPTITIPAARISQIDGNAIKAALASGTVNATLGLNPNVLAGADPAGFVELYAPVPVAAGSSVSHWDPIAFPNLLMEPAINADLTHSVDLTRQEMIDVGWFSDGDGVPDGRDQCLGSSRDATVIINNCNSGVPNTTFSNGCRISDLIKDCAAQLNDHDQGPFESCVAHLTNDLKKAGVITGKQKGAIESCAGQFQQTGNH